MKMLKAQGILGKASYTENESDITDTTETNDDKMEMKFIFNNEVTFSDNLQIEDFTEENSLNLGDLEQEQRNTLLQAIMERLELVNKQQMGELGLDENSNPISQYLISAINGNNNVLSNTDMNEIEITTFNEKFEMYGGTNVRGTTVRGLFTIISL